MSDPDDDLVDEFLKQKLKFGKVTSSGLIVGYLESRQAFEELVRDLKVFGCSFSVRSCYVGKDDRGTFQYSVSSDDLPIPFTGSPFRVEGTTYYLCSQGSRYYKRKTSTIEENKEEDGIEPAKKRRRKVNRAIKIGCPAKMTVKCIRVYPDYKASAKSWRRKCEVLKRLKSDMKQTPPPQEEVQYWISVSPESVHNHKRTTTQKIQPIHPDLITEIHRLVKNGFTTVPDVKSQLLSFVKEMFKNSSIHPEPSNTAFFPNDKSIYNHLHGAKTSLRLQNPQNLDIVSQESKNSSNPMETSTVAALSDEQVTQKPPDSPSSDVPILSNTLESEWQEQNVFSSNLVQVVNSNGMIMLMVAQPISEQMNNVENSLVDPGSNIMNVNLDDNIFEVSVDDPTEQMLGLADDTVMMSQACDSQDGLTPLCIDDNTNMLIDGKTNEVDASRIITLEGNVVVDVRNTYDKGTQDDEEPLECPGEQIPLLFSEDEQLQLVEQESRTAQSQISQESTEQKNGISIVEPRSNLYHHSQPCIISPQGVIKHDLQKTVVLSQQLEDQLLNNTSLSGASGSNLSTIRETLQDCVNDIIKMSDSCTNINLLEKTLNVLEKYRLRLHIEATEKQNSALKGLTPLIISSPNLSSAFKNNECVSGTNILCFSEGDIRSSRGSTRTFIKKINFPS